MEKSPIHKVADSINYGYFIEMVFPHTNNKCILFLRPTLTGIVALTFSPGYFSFSILIPARFAYQWTNGGAGHAHNTSALYTK